jgi:hypothetical protein
VSGKPATAGPVIRAVLAEADAFLSRPDADPLDLDLVRRARFDIEAYGFELVKILAAGEPEMADAALEWLAAVLQGVHLIGRHAGRPETAIQEGVQLAPLIKTAGMRASKQAKRAPWRMALVVGILTVTAKAGRRLSVKETTRNVNHRLLNVELREASYDQVKRLMAALDRAGRLPTK